MKEVRNLATACFIDLVTNVYRKYSFDLMIKDVFFDETKEENDGTIGGTTKFGHLTVDLEYFLAKHLDYNEYGTGGHSLGGALSTITSFYLSCDPDIPKQVSNVSFAAPRFGDKTFFEAVQHLEKTAQLRIIHSVNENDSVAAFFLLSLDIDMWVWR
jgi:hypothetical protein